MHPDDAAVGLRFDIDSAGSRVRRPRRLHAIAQEQVLERFGRDGGRLIFQFDQDLAQA